jgi:hypothetical protein
MPPRSAVERSEFRPEIDEFLLEGKSGRFVSEWLKSKKENISHTAINNYKKKHLNVEKEATIQYNEKKSKQKKQKKVDKVVSDLEALDDIIAEGHKIKLEVDQLTPDEYGGVTNLDIENVKIKAKRLTIQAAKVKHDITKDEPTPVILVKVEDADAEEQRLIEATADNLARQEEDSESIESECEDES